MIAFDISKSAIESARRRFPTSPVDFRVADLLNPPGEGVSISICGGDLHHAIPARAAASDRGPPRGPLRRARGRTIGAGRRTRP